MCICKLYIYTYFTYLYMYYETSRICFWVPEPGVCQEVAGKGAVSVATIAGLAENRSGIRSSWTI